MAVLNYEGDYCEGAVALAPQCLSWPSLLERKLHRPAEPRSSSIRQMPKQIALCEFFSRLTVNTDSYWPVASLITLEPGHSME
jgi:hypothetical protein